MKVLQICPLWCPVAPDAAGGRETLLARLVDALEQRGCRNVLLATGDSRTRAQVISVCPRNLWDQMSRKEAFEYAYYEQHQLMLALPRLNDFDVVHSHIGVSGLLLSALPGMRDRVLHTIHTPMYGDLQWFVSQHPDLRYSTVSEFQAERLRKHGAQRCEAIHNGIDVSTFAYSSDPGDSLFFLGRIEHGKGTDLAVQAALRLNMPLKLAGPILDQDFFDKTIKPHLGSEIEYVGVVNHDQKNLLFGRAACTVLPFRHEESFGMVMVESMACGTPVVALSNGAVPEIVENGLTGFHTSSDAELPSLIPRAIQLDRRAIRERVAARFDISTVAQRYHQLYERIVTERKHGGAGSTHAV